MSKARPILVAGLVAVTLGGWSAGSTKDALRASSGSAASVTIARPADVVTLDPASAGDNESIWTDQLLYSTLYKSSTDGKTLKPDLAQTMKQSPDGLTTTITLQPNAKFSDGRRITAADVKFSLDRNLAKTAAWSFIYSLVSKIDTPDPSTVVITTSKPMAAFESSFSLFASAILPMNFDGEKAAAFFAHPISSGPYVLKSWSKGDSMVLTANPNWAGTKLKTKQITFTVVPDDNTRVLQLRGGQVDAVEAPPSSQMSSLSSGDVKATAFPSTYEVNLCLNHAKGPLADINVRRAIAAALNRSAILRAAYFGSGKVAGAFLTSGVPYWTSTPIPAFNLAASKADMAKSGSSSGFAVNLVIPSGDASLNTTAEAIQEELSPLKIHVTVTPVESTAYFGQYFLTGKFDMTLIENSSDVPDPDEIVSAWATNKWYVNANSNYAAALSAQAASEFNRTKRAVLYSKILDSYAAQVVGLPMFDLSSNYAWNAQKLPHFTVTVLGSYDISSFS